MPVLIYKALLAVFGMDSPRPFQAASVATFLASTSLLFIWLRRRVSAWLALALVLPLLFFGPAHDDLLWPFQIGYFGSVAFGLGALLALDVDDRRWDLAACGLLAVSMGFSSVGIPFAVGVAVQVLTGPAAKRRAYVFVAPVALFGLWWLGYGRHAENHASVHDLLTAPGYILDGFAVSVSSMLGLATPRNDTGVTALDWGRPLLVALIGVASYALYRAGRVSRGLWVALATGISFWLLTALNSSLFRQPDNGRYEYLGAVFLVLIVGEFLRGVRFANWVLAGAVGVAVLAAASNLDYLHQGWETLKPQGEQQRAGLGALELIGNDVDPDFMLTSDNSDVDYLGLLDAGSYLSAVDAFGSPAFSPEQIAAASPLARVSADKVLASGLELRLNRSPIHVNDAPILRWCHPTVRTSRSNSRPGAPSSRPLSAVRRCLSGDSRASRSRSMSELLRLVVRLSSRFRSIAPSCRGLHPSSPWDRWRSARSTRCRSRVRGTRCWLGFDRRRRRRAPQARSLGPASPVRWSRTG